VAALYLIGYAKSLTLRPTLLFPDRLEIRLGILAQHSIDRSSIQNLTPCDQTRHPTDRRMFGLDKPNLHLSTHSGHILFRVDNPTQLIKAIAS